MVGRISGLGLILSLVLSNGPMLWGQTQVSVPEDAKFVIQLNLKALHESAIGRKIFNKTRQAIVKEMKAKRDGAGPDFNKLSEALGFDPFEEVQGLVIAGSDYDHPERSLVASVRLQKAKGNIEGLLMGIPGYEVSDYGKHEIYSARPEGDLQLHAAIHQDAEGMHTLLLSTDRSNLTNTLDHLDRRENSSRRFKNVLISQREGIIVDIQVLALPEDLGEGPHANVAKRLKSLTFQLGQVHRDTLDVELTLEAANEKQAEQIRQMAQGILAMVQFAQSIESEDKDLRKIAQLLGDVRAVVEGRVAKVSLSLPTAQVENWFEDEISF